MNADQIALTLLGLTRAYAAGAIELSAYAASVRGLQDWARELGLAEEVQHAFRRAAWESHRDAPARVA